MAVLVEGAQYGLSSPSLSSSSKSLVFVKLTDSALRSIEEFLRLQAKNGTASGSPTIQFHGNDGYLWFPGSNGHGSSYKFSLSSTADSEGPQGSFECLHQTTANRHLESLGPLSHKMRIHAKEDVYEATRQRMAVAEEESKKNCAVVLETSAPGIGRKVKLPKSRGAALSIPPRRERDTSASPAAPLPPFPPHLSTAAPTTRHRTAHLQPGRGSSNSSTASMSNFARPPAAISPLSKSNSSPPSSFASYNNSNTAPTPSTPTPAPPSTTTPRQPPPASQSNDLAVNPDLMRRPIRERIIHLLAVRPYKKPELHQRLTKEGIRDKEKKLIVAVLRGVSFMKDNAYHLARHVWNDVHDDWPFYSQQERQMLKRRKPQNLTPPGSDSSTGSSKSPSSSPSSSLHPCLPSPSRSPSSVTLPTTTNKRPHSLPLSAHAGSKDPNPAKRPRVSLAHASKLRTDPSSSTTSTLSSSSLHHFSSNISNIKNNNHVSHKNNNNSSNEPITSAEPDTPASSPESTSPGGVALEEDDYSAISSSPLPLAPSDPAPMPTVNPRVVEETVVPPLDPTSKNEYRRIENAEQRSRYKADFRAKYEEYRRLYGTIDKVSKRFAQLQDSLRGAAEGSDEWHRVRDQILREYRNSSRDTNYQAAKQRYNYLHQKLAHIKQLVCDYDTRIPTCQS